MPKFSFQITTRDGNKIQAVQIFGADMDEAEVKLRRMYRYCEINHAHEMGAIPKTFSAHSLEEILGLISR